MSNYQHIDFSKLDLPALCDHISNRHHTFLKHTVPLVAQQMKALLQEQGKESSEQLTTLYGLFSRFHWKIEMHIRKEETIFYPFIKLMHTKAKEDQPLSKPDLLEKPISLLTDEHDSLASLLAEIRLASKNYTPALEASADQKLIFAELQEIEHHVYAHVYLENNILFPMVRKIHQKIREKMIPETY